MDAPHHFVHRELGISVVGEAPAATDTQLGVLRALCLTEKAMLARELKVMERQDTVVENPTHARTPHGAERWFWDKRPPGGIWTGWTGRDRCRREPMAGVMLFSCLSARPSSAASRLKMSQRSALGCSRSAYPTSLRPFLLQRTIFVPTPTIALTNNQNQTLLSILTNS